MYACISAEGASGNALQSKYTGPHLLVKLGKWSSIIERKGSRYKVGTRKLKPVIFSDPQLTQLQQDLSKLKSVTEEQSKILELSDSKEDSDDSAPVTENSTHDHTGKTYTAQHRMELSKPKTDVPVSITRYGRKIKNNQLKDFVY